MLVLSIAIGGELVRENEVKGLHMREVSALCLW